MMPNKNAQNIWIKKLTKKDRTMLATLRAMLQTCYNSEAILKAGYLCLEQKVMLSEKDALIQKAHKQKDAIEEKLIQLQEQLLILFKLEGNYEKHYETMKQHLLKASKGRSIDLG